VKRAPVSNIFTRAKRLKWLLYGPSFAGVDCVLWYDRIEPSWSSHAGWTCVICGAIAHTKEQVTHRRAACQKELDTLLLFAQYLHGVGILPSAEPEQMT